MPLCNRERRGRFRPGSPGQNVPRDSFRLVRAFIGRGLGDGAPIAESGGPTGRERGSAVVEFTFLALLLMVPVVYFIITVSQIQGGSFAVVGAADQAAKVYVAQPDEASSLAAAEQAVAIALNDFGYGAEAASVAVACAPADCSAAGSAVSVTVRLGIPLPFLPFGEGFRLGATEVEASSTQLVGRFR